MTDAARDQILRSIRENLGVLTPYPPLPPGEGGPPLSSPSPEQPALSVAKGRGGQGVRTPDGSWRQELRTRFTTQLEAVGAQWTLVRGEVEAARALRRILADAGAKRVAGSDAPLVARLLPERLVDLTRDELFSCDAGVTTAQWGIAETGTLVLESVRERSRLASLVPPVHVALLSTACIVASLGDALARLDVTSHAITLITGPSRTSDIELTLVVGVHGPQMVHVLLLEEA